MTSQQKASLLYATELMYGAACECYGGAYWIAYVDYVLETLSSERHAADDAISEDVSLMGTLILDYDREDDVTTSAGGIPQDLDNLAVLLL
jgi:hypothetical protein